MQKPQFGLNQKATLLVVFIDASPVDLPTQTFLIKRPRHWHIPGDFIHA
jgi:hypothetical protein